MPEDFAKMVNFGCINLKRVYGESWRERWEEISCHILMENGINSQGNFPGIRVMNGAGEEGVMRRSWRNGRMTPG